MKYNHKQKKAQIIRNLEKYGRLDRAAEKAKVKPRTLHYWRQQDYDFDRDCRRAIGRWMLR